MKMHLVALAGLASGSAVFSGCANGDSNSTSGQQQKTPAKSYTSYQRSRVPESNLWVDWSKPWKDQKKNWDLPEPNGMGMP